MKLIKVCLFSLGTFFSFYSYSQELYKSVNVKAAIEKGTRSENGKPGSNYWQNKADYKMKINFDPQTKVLSGEETITYYNNSPDSLNNVAIRLYSDLYKKGVERNVTIDPKDENDGVTIEAVRIGNEEINEFNNTRKIVRSGTNMYLTPAKAIQAKSVQTIYIKWHYTVNTGSQMRTGAVDETSYFIAYSFPRVSVYDDVNGWDYWSYKGTQEFYNDFGDFDVEITASKNYVVWATGELQNATDNLSATVLKRLKSAAITNKNVHVIDSTDYKKITFLRLIQQVAGSSKLSMYLTLPLRLAIIIYGMQVAYLLIR